MKAAVWQGKGPDAGPVPIALSLAVFALGDVHCWVCADTLELALSGLAGVASVAVHPVTGRTWIAYDPELVTEGDLLEAIGYGGFDAQVLERTELWSAGARAPGGR
jgi:copper chaperone CopZ